MELTPAPQPGAALAQPEGALALPDDALALLDAALARAEGPVELFLHARREESWLLDAHGGGATQSRGVELSVTARVWRDARCGIARRTVTGAQDLEQALADAAANAAAGPQLALPAPAPVHPAGPRPGFHGGSVDATLRTLAQKLEPLGTRIQVLLGRQEHGWIAVASSVGVRAAQWTPSERILVRVEHPRGALVDGAEGALREPPALFPLVERLGAAVDALGGEGGAPAPELPWWLAPSVAAPLVSGLGWLLSGDTAAALPGLVRAHGKRIFPGRLTFSDGAGLPVRTVDDEGQPRPELVLVRDGKLEQFAHASDSAATLRQVANGRAVRAQSAGFPTAQVRAPTLLPGSDAPPPDRNELVARTETFVVAPRGGKVLLVVAGWVVRGGVRVARIAPFEVELPVLDTFRGLLLVGADAAHFPTVDGVTTPSLLIAPPKP